MKFVTQEEIDAHQRYVVTAGAKGFAGGLAFSLPASYFLHQRWPYYRHLPLSLKTFGVIGIAVPAFAICAERASQRYDRLHWNDEGKRELDMVAQKEADRRAALQGSDRITDWAKRNQYSIIGTSWLAGVGASSAIIMRDRQQTFAQKIVQVRMWAQGLTIGVFLLAGILTHQDRQRRIAEKQVDHSWQAIVEAQQEQHKV